jgi:hypothetical protein
MAIANAGSYVGGHLDRFDVRSECGLEVLDQGRIGVLVLERSTRDVDHREATEGMNIVRGPFAAFSKRAMVRPSSAHSPFVVRISVTAELANRPRAD